MPSSEIANSTHLFFTTKRGYPSLYHHICFLKKGTHDIFISVFYSLSSLKAQGKITLESKIMFCYDYAWHKRITLCWINMPSLDSVIELKFNCQWMKWGPFNLEKNEGQFKYLSSNSMDAVHPFRALKWSPFCSLILRHYTHTHTHTHTYTYICKYVKLCISFVLVLIAVWIHTLH